MRTRAEIGRDIREAKRRIAELLDPMTCEEVQRKAHDLAVARTAFHNRNSEALGKVQEWHRGLEKEWRESHKASLSQLHPKALAWFTKYGRRWGSDSGPALRPVWSSENGEWLIATWPSHKFWQSIMNPSATGEAWHMLFRTSGEQEPTAKLYGGRLTKDRLKELKSKAK
ncbi:MAG: hypothetical protein WCK90_00560 [archaeon]